MKPQERVKAWRENKMKSGSRIITVAVPADCHQTLKDIRLKTRESYGEIIGRLIDPGSIQVSNRGFRRLTIDIPADEWKRLEKEYPGDELKVHLETYLADKAECLLWAETGDF